MNIIAISGSLRRASFNTALLKTCAELAPADMNISLADISAIPLYNGDDQTAGFPASVTALADQIRSADAVLIATPEYNYSIPGVLKNTIDWLSRVENQPFDNKPVGIMGAAMGALGTARSQYHLRQVFVFLNGRLMNRPEVFVGGAHQKFDENGKLTDQQTREFLGSYLTAFEAWAKA
ncbi:MAG: NADPH-dependent FMN reductase [Pseudomonadota bacterium]